MWVTLLQSWQNRLIPLVWQYLLRLVKCWAQHLLPVSVSIWQIVYCQSLREWLLALVSKVGNRAELSWAELSQVSRGEVMGAEQVRAESGDCLSWLAEETRVEGGDGDQSKQSSSKRRRISGIQRATGIKATKMGIETQADWRGGCGRAECLESWWRDQMQLHRLRSGPVHLPPLR